MSDTARSVLLGTLAAIVLAPIILAVWQALSPPCASRTARLSTEAWQRNAVIARQSLFVAVGIPTLLAAPVLEAFDESMRLLVVITFPSLTLAAPLLWVCARNVRRGREGLKEFGTYLEAKEGISFRSWMYFSGIAGTIGILGYVVLLLGAHK